MSRKMRAVFPLAVLAGLSAGNAAHVDNTQPRRDISGKLMDIHDGNVMQWQDGKYYWYGMGYKDCQLESSLMPPVNCPGIYRSFGHCGFRTDHALNVYSSTDLENWTFEGDAFPMSARPNGIYFRPKVVHNARTNMYVLWINFLAQNYTSQSPLSAYPNATYVVAASKSPVGPFTVVRPSADVMVSGGGDFALFVDKGSAYIAYNSWHNSHRIKIEKLDEDFYASLGASASTPLLSPSSNEAPMLFERKGWYYLLYGHTCCFCSGGAGAHVQVSQNPLGPWMDTGIDINPLRSFSLTRHIIPSQNNFVFQVGVGGTAEYVFTADMWSSAPDRLKSHDLQYWSPLTFDDSVSPPLIRKLEWHDAVTINVGEARLGPQPPRNFMV